MSAVWLRARVWSSRHIARLVVLAALVGVVGGVAIGLAGGARRTESAPARYTAAAGGDPDISIQQQRGDPLDRVIADVPGVVDVKAQVFVPSFLVSPLDGMPLYDLNAFAGDADLIGTRVVEGRFPLPSEPNTFTANRPMADVLSSEFDLGVGDRIEVVSFSRRQVLDRFEEDDAPAVPAFTATLVGITEAPADFENPYPTIVFPRSFLDAHPDVGVVQSLLTARVQPGGDPGVVLAAMQRQPDGADAFPIPGAVVSDSVRRAVRYQSTALWIVAGLGGLAAAVVIAQVVSRTMRVGADERTSLLALGWRRREIAAERVIVSSSVAVMAIPVALATAALVTIAFPLGSLDQFEPDPGLHIDAAALGAGAAALVATVWAAAAAAARGAHGTQRASAQPGSIARLVSGHGAGMPMAVAARFVTPGGRRAVSAWASLLAGAVGISGIVGAVTLGWTLDRLDTQRARWGENYDLVLGNPFVEADHDVVRPLVDDQRVGAATGAHIGALTIGGHETSVLAFEPAKGDLVPVVLDGHVPLTDSELALGAEVARRLGVDVGESVEVSGASGSTLRMAVVGVAVTPGTAGNGAALRFSAYQRLNPTATQNLVLVDVADGAPAGTLEALAEANYTPPGSVATPPSVLAVHRVTAAPYLLVGVLAVSLLCGGSYLFTSSVRSRRRDLDILRALGPEDRQLTSTVHLQATLGCLVLVAIGLPLGLLVGRWIVSALSDAIGIVPVTDVPVVAITAIVVAAVIAANLIALGPARSATRRGAVALTAE